MTRAGCRAGRWLGLGLLAVVGLGALVACSSAPTPTPAPRVVRLEAPTSTRPMLQALIAAYEQQAPRSLLTFDVQAATSQVALDALHNGQADLAVSSWLTSTNLPGISITPMAWDATAVIIHPRNPLTDVTLLQLRDLYRGYTLDWAALGGRADDVTVVSRQDGSGLRAAFEHAVMGDQPVTRGAVVLPSDAAVIDFVRQQPTAIGYVSLLGLQSATSAGGRSAQVKTLPVEGVVPDSTNLLHGGYHLVHPLYLLAHQPVPDALRPFIEFAVSPAGQAIMAQYTTGARDAS